MSVGIASLDSVLARIAQIQASLPGAPVTRSSTASSAGSATSSAAAQAAAAIRSELAPALSATTGATIGTPAGSLSFASALAGIQSAVPSSLLPSAADTGVSGSDLVASAEKYLGVPYVFGGTTSSGLDCSGLLQRAYGDLGIALPRVAADQATVGVAVPSLAQAQPGDILAFGKPAHHVAMYLGDNKMIAAPEPGDKVKIQSVYETPATIRRLVGPDALGAGSSLPAGLGQPAGLTQQAAGLAQYAGVFAQNEARYQLPAGLLTAVAQTESGGNPTAVSPAGAQGLMQLMPGTARGLGVDPWVPAQAIQGAAQLLSKYLHSYGSVPLALAAYNAGPGAVEQYGGVPPYAETQNYVTKITGLMAGRAG
jgi:cell wall-associated NlpC family hydrolase